MPRTRGCESLVMVRSCYSIVWDFGGVPDTSIEQMVSSARSLAQLSIAGVDIMLHIACTY
jgi:hypothetical protein